MPLSSFSEKISSGKFVVTAEVCPPKGSDYAAFLQKAKILSGVADAINVTDNQGANMRISPVAAAALLAREGIEPVLQLTCRDRNRLALQSELLGAAALGVTNVLALTGDHITLGDHRQAKSSFDLDSVQLIAAISSLNNGFDMAGNRLEGTTCHFVGAAAAPEAEPFEPILLKLQKKVEAGARFFQTQAVFDIEKFQRFTEMVRPIGAPVIGGILLLKSASMARFVNRAVPGLRVPDDLIAELESAPDQLAKGVEIAGRIARKCLPHCQGIHIMAMGREDLVPHILKLAHGN